MSGIHTKRILRAFDSASDEQMDEGLHWYEHASAMCSTLADRHGMEYESVVGICAALSPRLSWTRNVLALEQTLRGQRPHPLIGLSWSKALRILHGDDVETVLNGALKTTAFFHNIRTGGDVYERTGHVTVDRHAYRIAMGLNRRDVGDPEFGVRAYREIAESYRRAAKLRGVTPAQVQSVTWQALHKTNVQTVWTERIAS